MIGSRSVSLGRPVPIALLLLTLACSSALAGIAPAPRKAGPALRFGVAEVDFLQNIVVGTAPCDDCQTQVCAGEPVLVRVSGLLPNSCYKFRGLHDDVLRQSPVVVADFVVDTCACLNFLEPVGFVGEISLAPQSAGQHLLSARADIRYCPDTTVVAEQQLKTVAYTVLDSCPPPPPPPPPGLDSLVRSFVKFEVAPERHCPNDSLSLLFIKNGCPPCVHLTSLEPDSFRAFFHATFDWRPNCLEFACIPETLSMPIGRFVPGFFTLTGRVDAHVLDPLNGDTVVSFDTRVAFEVQRTCSTVTPPCMSPFLLPGALRTPCALTVPPGGANELTLSARPPVPLGGFQGRIDVTAPFVALRARAPDFMTGLHVVSRRDPDGRGLSYIAFTDPGRPIDVVKGPVLEVDVAADSGATPGSTGSMTARVTVASDPDGGDVPICNVIPLGPIAGITLCVSAGADSCDANGDGHADVRDLVLMTHCFPRALSGLDSTRICSDCDGDGVFSFDDLFCCARMILRLPLVPVDSMHASSALRVSFDPPRPWNGGLLVRTHVTGADALGAALVRLHYPAERWRAVEWQAPAPGHQGPEAWMSLVDTDEPGRVQLGGIRVSDRVGRDLAFDLIFTPTTTPLPGDKIEVVGANLAAPDGTVLTPMDALPELTLDTIDPPGTTVLELSPPTPNPFGTSTRLSVSLPKTAQVELVVLDLAGRRVATLAHGVYGAGRQTFTWDGANAHDGLYFVRLRVDHRVLSTRVALLRNNP